MPILHALKKGLTERVACLVTLAGGSFLSAAAVVIGFPCYGPKREERTADIRIERRRSHYRQKTFCKGASSLGSFLALRVRNQLLKNRSRRIIQWNPVNVTTVHYPLERKCRRAIKLFRAKNVLIVAHFSLWPTTVNKTDFLCNKLSGNPLIAESLSLSVAGND